MRLHINLASHPYEVARQYRQRMTMLIAALGVIFLALGGYIVYQRAHSRIIIRQIAEAQAHIDLLDTEERQARAMLTKPANRQIADQSQFLNDLFARKALSWTRIFMEMERIVPANLHVVSMKPDYTKTNDLVVHMIVVTDSRDKAIELVRRMEKSSHFRAPQVVAEAVVSNTTDQAAGGNIQFDIAAIYVPAAQDQEEPIAEEQKTAENANPGAPAGAAVKPGASVAAETKPGAANPKSPAPANMKAAQNRPLPPSPGGAR